MFKKHFLHLELKINSKFNCPSHSIILQQFEENICTGNLSQVTFHTCCWKYEK